MGRDDAPLPVHVAGFERLLQRVGLQQQPQRRDLAQVFRRDRSDLEAALPLGKDEPFGRQPIEQLTKGADTGAVVLAQPLELQSLCRSELAENDVGANAPVGLLADRIVVRGSCQHSIEKSQFSRHRARRPAVTTPSVARKRVAATPSHYII